MKKKKGSSSSSSSSNDEIVDERFLAATNRPQFRSRRHNKNNKSKHSADNNNNDDGTHQEEESSGTLHSTNININTDNNNNGNINNGDGFGESLAQAIRSDDRFSEALTNSEKFGCVPGMDKYGRKIKKTKKNQQRRRDDEDEEDDVSEKEEPQPKKKDNAPLALDMESRIAYLNALSRGDISASSSDDDNDANANASSDDSEDSSDDDSSTNDIHGQAGVFDPSYNQLPGDYPHSNNGDDDDNSDMMEQLTTTDPTPYLCILNLDWEHTRAVDVYAMLQSFCPPGTLKRVEIYPSDFGTKMMEKERLEGPSGLWKTDAAAAVKVVVMEAKGNEEYNTYVSEYDNQLNRRLRV